MVYGWWIFSLRTEGRKEHSDVCWLENPHKWIVHKQRQMTFDSLWWVGLCVEVLIFKSKYHKNKVSSNNCRTRKCTAVSMYAISRHVILYVIRFFTLYLYTTPNLYYPQIEGQYWLFKQLLKPKTLQAEYFFWFQVFGFIPR